MYLHIPMHNVQSDLLDYGMNLFTQKDHKGEYIVNFLSLRIKVYAKTKTCS